MMLVASIFLFQIVCSPVSHLGVSCLPNRYVDAGCRVEFVCWFLMSPDVFGIGWVFAFCENPPVFAGLLDLTLVRFDDWQVS